MWIPVLVILVVAASGLLSFALFRLSRARFALLESEMRLAYSEARLVDREKNEMALKNAARAEFEQLAARLFEQEVKQLQETSERGLEQLLSPLKERLKDFEKRVEDSYQAEGRERHVLKSEIVKLIELNEKMSHEARSLAEALRGDTKVQGDWGEIVLENILSASGLHEGSEYVLQKSFENESGERFRPDVVIQLPDGKQIIIDAKVSLTAYEAYTALGGEAEDKRERRLQDHVDSLSRHVDELSERHYHRLKGLKTPEFVFLFTPIEAAYVLAMKRDPELATRAWKKGVAVVSATTLFTSLKTVAGIWRLENQNRNAQAIADEAARLYDKFVGFYEDFERIGRSLETGLNQFEDARRKLREGPGNVFRKIEVLRELGAAPSKRLKPELFE